MLELTLFTLVASLCVGASILWANYRRLVNQLFALFSLTATLWLWFVYLSLRTGQLYHIDNAFNPVPWLRAASATGSLFPWILWLLKESVASLELNRRKLIIRSLPWLIICILLGAICFTDLFIPSNSTPDNQHRGIAYPVFSFVSATLYIVLIIGAIRQTRFASGIRRLEMQFLTVNTSIACLITIALTGLGYYLNLRFLARLAPTAGLILYAFTAWVITFHRVFDARQIFLSVAQRLIVVIFICCIVFTIWHVESRFHSTYYGVISIVIVCSLLTLKLDELSRGWFKLSLERTTTDVRRTIIDWARTESNPEKLLTEFEHILCEWGSTRRAALLFDHGEYYSAANIDFQKVHPGYEPLCKIGWTTPESLQRQRYTPALNELRDFLTRQSLGVIVTAPRQSLTPSLLLALAIKINQRPFTYPEVRQLQEIAELMDNTLARSRLSLQARQSEQLATIGLIGASLAHEIRNPLTAIKTFVHFLPTRYDDPEFREKFSRLVPDEVDRIDNLTQQLLDLSNPRPHQLEAIGLNSIVKETIDLLQNRASQMDIALNIDIGAALDNIHADRGAIRQVLINLIVNAFQSLEHKNGEKKVDVCTRNVDGGVRLDIADNGPGIPPEMRQKLFQPFQSTKTKGMGLGLTICADILRKHHATITIPDEEREGALFRIVFPWPPPSS